MPANRVETQAPAPRTGDGTLPPLLQKMQMWTVVLFLFSVGFHFAQHLRHATGYLANPLSSHNERFGDFTVFFDKFDFFHTSKFFQVGFPINYPAPVALCFEIFYKFFRVPVHEFVVFSVLCFLVPAALFARSLMRRGIAAWRAGVFTAILCLLSWPIVLLIDRGNIEVTVWLAVIIAMWAYATGREWTAAAFFGIAASLKLFPFVFLALFLTRRQFPKLLFGTATFFAVSIVSLKILGPTISEAYHGITFGLGSFKQNYMATWLTNEGGVDHSIFGSFKGLMVLLFHHPDRTFGTSLSVYLVLTAVGGILLYFLHIRKLPLLNQIFALTIASIYLTAFSGDATLVHLYPPTAMLFYLCLRAWRDGVRISGLKIAVYCLTVCFSFETFLTFYAYPNDVRLIGSLHCIALGVLFVTVLRFPLGPPLSQELGPTVLSQPVTDWAHASIAS
jgi:hypothetical protein